MSGTAKNAPCPCGSGVKYKKCCLPKEQAAAKVDASQVRSGAESSGTSRLPTDFGRGGIPRQGGFGQALGEYIQPLIDRFGDSPDMVKKSVSLGMLFWNLSLCEDDATRTQSVTAMMDELHMDSPRIRAEFQDLAKLMLLRHHTMFPGLHRDATRARGQGISIS
ncbi:MAG: SEC-C domain-containing protein [Planctomycetes bacterium]|nr:SEC-C domain-containing protein [Planctomycetota bacterium]